MKPKYKSFDELPLCLNVQDVADVMGVSKPVAYELANRADFPAIRMGDSGKRIVVPRDRFRAWLAGIELTDLPYNQIGNLDDIEPAPLRVVK